MSEPLEWYNLPHLHYWTAMFITAHSHFAKRAMTMPSETFRPVKYADVPTKHQLVIEALARHEGFEGEPDFTAMTCREGKPGVLAGWYKL